MKYHHQKVLRCDDMKYATLEYVKCVAEVTMIINQCFFIIKQVFIIKYS